MAISRKSADDFASDLENGILSRNTQHDTKVGPIPDLIIRPLAGVLELQNERIRVVQQLLSLINDGTFTDSDVDSFVYNELLQRLNGSRSTVTLIFSRATIPTANVTVKANFPVGTLADEETGVAVTFYTLADATLFFADAASYFNSATQRYELQVSAQSIIGTSASNVAANRIVRPLKTLNGFDSVFNRAPSAGGADIETTDRLVDRYYLSLMGTSPGVVTGIDKILRDQYANVLDSNVIFGNNPLNIRAALDAGAVDVYVIGETLTSYAENIIFSGTNQSIQLAKQPVVSITSATGYVQGTDFSLVKSTGGNANSVRAVDGIKWLTTGTSPAIGAVVPVTYVYNILPTTLQNDFTSNDKLVPGRDILFKVGDQIDVTLSANIKIRPGFGISSVVTAVSTAILDLINTNKLSDDVEASDIQGVVRAFSSVDNFVITNLAKAGSTGTSDILIGDSEYSRMESADLILTVI